MAPSSTQDHQRSTGDNGMMHRHHLYAKLLNNSAASCIEVGYYDRAICSLSKALRLTELALAQEGEIEAICSCYHLNVDSCIEFTESNAPIIVNSSFGINNNGCFYVVKHLKPSLLLKSINYDNDEDSVGVSGFTGYIYRRPIQVTPRSINEGHNMGSTLFLIITLNLAMAYHLKAVENSSINIDVGSITNNKKETMNIALKLYDMAINRNCNGSSSSPASLSFNHTRFNMIIYSNMNQIHRFFENHKPYKLCLEQLLSTIMLVAEYMKTNVNVSTTNDATNDVSNTSSMPYQNSNDLRRTDILDGFLQNTGPLMMAWYTAPVQHGVSYS
jgi:hypothetical protein